MRRFSSNLFSSALILILIEALLLVLFVGVFL